MYTLYDLTEENVIDLIEILNDTIENENSILRSLKEEQKNATILKAFEVKMKMKQTYLAFFKEVLISFQIHSKNDIDKAIIDKVTLNEFFRRIAERIPKNESYEKIIEKATEITKDLSLIKFDDEKQIIDKLIKELSDTREFIKKKREELRKRKEL
jgi:hypothetical protein